MAASDARPVPRKNTAYRITFPIFDADGDLVSGATGLDTELSGDGGTFADATNEATEIATNSGMYYLDLTAGEMNYDTVAIIVKTSSSGAKTTPLVLYPEELGDFRVDVGMISGDSTAADNLESYCDGTTPIPANATQLSGDATAADNAESFFDGTGYAGTNNVIPTVTNVTNLHASAATAAELAKVPKSDSTVTWNATALASINAEVDTALNTAIPGSPTANSINERIATMDGLLLGTIAAGTHNPQSGDSYGIVNSGTYGNAALNTKLGTPAGASVSADIAAVKSDSAAILVDTGTTLDARIPAALVSGRMDCSVGAIAANAITAASMATDAGAEIADAVWDEALSGHSAAGSAGLALSSASAPSAAAVADAVWDEAISGHLGAGTTGNALNAAGSAGDPWSTPLPGAYGAGTAGKIIGDNINAPIGTVDTVVDGIASMVTDIHGTDLPAVKADTAAILLDTGTDGVVLPQAQADKVWGAAARTLTAGTNIALAKGTGVTGFNDLSATDVRTAVGLASANLDTQLADIPTVAEFNARSLPSADYTVVSDLPVAPDNASITAILEDTGTTIPATLAALPVAAKKNTALANFGFVMTDSTNHELATGQTVTCTRSVDGGAFGAGTLANVTEIGNGLYNVDFGAGDLNGDVVVLRATATGCDDTIVTIVTAK